MPNTNPPPVTSFKPFSQDKQDKLDKLARAQAQKMQSVAHFPKKVNIPGVPNVPLMTPVPDQGPMAAAQQSQTQRPGVAVFTPQPQPNTQAHEQSANMQADAMFAQARSMQQQQPQTQAHNPQQRSPLPLGANVGNHEGFARADALYAAHEHRQPMAAPVTEPMAYTQQVNNPHVGFTNAIADAESMSLALPSRFHYYGFKDFYARPFVTKHIAKLQKAHREQSLLPIVEAVSSVCFTTDPNYRGYPIAFDLSLPDFFFVLYWLRLNSFTKSNYIHSTKCNNEAHLERVEIGLNHDALKAQVMRGELSMSDFEAKMALALPESSLNISQIVMQTDLKVNELDTVPDPEVHTFGPDSQMYLRPPTMRDVIEFAESPELLDMNQRQEFSFIAQLATHIQLLGAQLSLAERVDIVGNSDPDYIAIIKNFERAIKGYGVVEKIKVQCKECGAMRETKLSIMAHNFFPVE
jgi:hypothetical protein